jgi:hypothetical protein
MIYHTLPNHCACRPRTKDVIATKDAPLAVRAKATGIPRSVQDAAMNDGEAAARSLAQQFAGNNAPTWYSNLPKASRALFATSGTPTISSPTAPATTSPACPANKKNSRKDKQYRKKQKAVANARSKMAKAQSKLAKYINCDALKQEAKKQQDLAKLEKQNSRKLSRAKKNAASTTMPKTSMLFIVSFTVAAATLGLAAYL